MFRRRNAWVAATLLLSSASAPAMAATASPAKGTQEMAAILAELVGKVDPLKLPYTLNGARADAILRSLNASRDLAETLTLRFNYAKELVNAGRVPEALDAIAALEREAEAANPANWRRHRHLLLMVKAQAYLRLAEDQNCCAANNRNSCLLPIRGEGIHKRREGGEKAIEVLGTVLQDNPGHLAARWLLNLAHMTLGTYPQAVPAPHLIPPATFASEYPLPRFENISQEVGLNLFGLAGGAVLDDFDGDRRLDLLVSNMGLDDPLRLLRNSGEGRFENVTEGTGLDGIVGGLNMIQGDYDNDGRVDVLVLRGGWMGTEGRFPVSLLHNEGNGRFADVTLGAGIDHRAPTQTAVWLDYDGDGRLDLFIGNESTPDSIHPCELYHNNGDGTFTERAAEVGLDLKGYVKGVVSADYDNDRRPDLYLSLSGDLNHLFRNLGPDPARPGGWRFEDVTAQAGVAEPKASFSTFFFDYDNDGWSDLWVTGYGWSTRNPGPMVEDVASDYLGLPHGGAKGKLYRNRGDGTFADITAEAGLDRVVPAMGINFGDLDNDGWLDFYAGTGSPELSTLIPNRMFRNDAGKRFQDVTTAGDFGNVQKGHAIAFGDFDNDGDQDVFEQMGGAFSGDRSYSVLFENPGNDNAWVVVELLGARSNRSAIGARIQVTVDEGGGKTRTVHRTVGSGGSFGASPLRQEIGLGTAKKIVSIEVFWPSTGERQRFEKLDLRRLYRIREGDPRASAAALPAAARRRPHRSS